MVELLTGAVFTMFLDKGNDYYVKPVKDDPPDVEVLAVERDSRAFSTMKLEIVQDGKYSESVFEVIGKKLAKRYERGTVLVVVIEETEHFLIAELHDFIRDNNPHGLRIYIIGGTGKAGMFKGMPCDEITCDGADYFEWKEMEVNQRERNAGFLASPLGSARSSPGREAAKRTLDGEDRSATMPVRGERGFLPTGAPAPLSVRHGYQRPPAALKTVAGRRLRESSSLSAQLHFPYEQRHFREPGKPGCFAEDPVEPYAARVASMRPRSFDRGNQAVAEVKEEIISASMRPRSFDRGNAVSSVGESWVSKLQ